MPQGVERSVLQDANGPRPATDSGGDLFVGEAKKEAHGNHLLLVICQLLDGVLHILAESGGVCRVLCLELGVFRLVSQRHGGLAGVAFQVIDGEVARDAVQPC